MSQGYANAYPRKNFFIQMFTKDISLEDCILDLIDNSIDGLIRSRKLKLSAISRSIFARDGKKTVRIGGLPTVNVTYSGRSVEIKDDCGGIDLDYARTEAFNFGHGPHWESGYLGAYGVGLKRALFKMGDEFEIESHTPKNGFACRLNVPDWLQEDTAIEDWRIPLDPKPRARSKSSAGTSIAIRRLHEEVRMRLSAGSIDTTLYKAISQTYAFFLQKHVRVFLNGTEVEPFRIPTARPSGGTVSYDDFVQDGVRVRIMATIAERDKAGRYDQESAGWYVVCNGRVVLHNDKSEISGWGVRPMPTYQPKHRSFVGLVFFEADNPLRLPWTTTKRGLNRESPVYLRVRGKMAAAARPVLSFINRQYPADRDQEPAEREIARTVESASVGGLVGRANTSFSVPPARQPTPRTTTRVQYDAKDSDLAKIRKHLRKHRMSAIKIGEHTFKYFLDKEGLA